MISLTTGLPGAGKTLLTLSEISELARKDNRPVFYKAKENEQDWGIDGLSPDLGWHKIDDAERWFDAPTGAIIVLDEAQKLFRPRGNGTAVPQYEAELETHRHRGHDLFLITQHPMLLSTNVRRLVEVHRHIVRAFGAQAATVHQFTELRIDCEKRREGSQQKLVPYPKQAFKLYRSAEVHTHKFRMPRRVLVLAVVPVVLGLCIWGFMSWQSSTAKPKIGPQATAATGEAGASAASARPMTTREYVASYIPRVPGVPASAPRYDQVTRPQTAPRIAVCVSSSSKCQCYTQQGTHIDSSEDVCRKVSREGIFDDTQQDQPAMRQAQQRQDLPGQEDAPREKPATWSGGSYGAPSS